MADMFQSSDCEDCCTSINTSLEDGHTVSRSAKVTKLELSTDLREVLQCPEKAPTKLGTSLLVDSAYKIALSVYKIENLLRHYA